MEIRRKLATDLPRRQVHAKASQHKPNKALSTMTVITRFAPSPTGYLHIGGARTALFNYLFAKANGGQYLLRIEDTDKARSTDDAKQAILDGLSWLGLAHDGEVIYQGAREARHREVAEQLLASGAAYKCFCTPEEANELKQKFRLEKKQFRSPWRDRPSFEHPDDKPYVVRIKAIQAENFAINDAVQGRVEIPVDEIDDFIILRSDGTPTYMLAVVVDDHDMGVTHIIRGDDHLLNTFKQEFIYMGMKWNSPKCWAHIPLIHGADGAKLSKRHGALGVMEYAEMGYLPEALRNYLLRLGWSHGDDEIISDEQAAQWFNLEHINKAPARFDFAKLEDLNGHYIRAADNKRLSKLCAPIIEQTLSQKIDSDRLLRAMPALKERAKTIPKLAASALFYFRDHNPPEDEKAQKQLDDGRELMAAFLPELEAQTEWNHEALFAFARSWAEARSTKIGALMAPIRVAITGSTGAPSMFEVMELLGKDESLRRLKLQLQRILHSTQ